MHTLVTGGAGFIGHHLVRALLARGERVRVLDDLSTGSRENVPPGATFVRGDVRGRLALARALGGVGRVVHLAAAVGPALVARDPRGTWSRNALGTLRVVEACARRRVPLLLASSSEVYAHRGVPSGRLLGETDPVGADPGDRRGVYALSKLAGEAAAQDRHRRSGLPVCIVRCFNVVGARQSPRHGMVLARFAEAARAGRPLTVYGDGLQRRCFLHVLDAVDAFLALLETPAARGLVVNVGGTDEVTVLDLARRVARAAGREVAIRHRPLAAVYGPAFGDPRRRRPDLRRLRDLTGWRARRTLDDAIRAALEGGARVSPASPAATRAPSPRAG